jgi:hypothetical protein
MMKLFNSVNESDAHPARCKHFLIRNFLMNLDQRLYAVVSLSFRSLCNRGWMWLEVLLPRHPMKP